MMDGKRFLDCTELSMKQFTKIQNGYNDFLNNDNKARYFGYVDKKRTEKIKSCIWLLRWNVMDERFVDRSWCYDILLQL